MNHYHINVFYSEEDERYIAGLPDLKFCYALGPTPEEAVRELGSPKLFGWKQLAPPACPIPEPRY